MRVEVLPDATAVAQRGAAIVADRARAAVAERGRFAVALSGGRTPWAMVAALAGEDLPWEHVSVFQVDERVALDSGPDRNLTQLLAALPPAAAPAEIAPMSVTGDLDDAAKAYAALLPRRLDLVHLGLGPDGHTASLVPGDPVLAVADRDVAPTGVYQDRRRLTLTYPALNRAREVLWLVTGEDKRGALRRLRDGDMAIPAGRVQTAVQVLVADVAAAGEV